MCIASPTGRPRTLHEANVSLCPGLCYCLLLLLYGIQTVDCFENALGLPEEGAVQLTVLLRVTATVRHSESFLLRRLLATRGHFTGQSDQFVSRSLLQRDKTSEYEETCIDIAVNCYEKEKR